MTTGRKPGKTREYHQESGKIQVIYHKTKNIYRSEIYFKSTEKQTIAECLLPGKTQKTWNPQGILKIWKSLESSGKFNVTQGSFVNSSNDHFIIAAAILCKSLESPATRLSKFPLATSDRQCYQLNLDSRFYLHVQYYFPKR